MSVKVKITFPDNSKKSYKKGITGLEIAKSIGERLARDALAIKINDELKDLSYKINKDAKIKIITFKDKEGVEVFRHSTAHLLAHAVIELFPDAKLTIGPIVEEGFYYDFDFRPFTPKDLKKIEEKMHSIMKQDLEIERIELTKKEAKKLFKDNKYKLELIEEFGSPLSAYRQGDFIDLCKGPHVPSTRKLKAFKLIKIAGAYWKGDSKNKQLQRIYGISFPERSQLKKYLHLLEEAEKRDHRKLGKQLDLFSMHEEAPGFPFFHPKGMLIKNLLIEFWREKHKKEAYVEIQTPIILNKSLWEKSGHWKNFRENMYFTRVDEQDYAIKPMNCPGGILVYKEKVHSYKEFPLRVAELGIVHRHEISGVLSGLFRVRAFTQDDAHIYITQEQIKDEIINIINLTANIYKVFGFDYHVELSTRPAKSIGTDEQWKRATNGLKDALDAKKISYKINKGEGAFYGPKIDFHLKDCLGRTWQCGTIQLDMAQPINFGLSYEGKDGRKHTPVMIHRTIYGSLERFIGILIEHFAGKFPLWLAPTQILILTVADRFIKYTEKLKDEFEKNNFRVELDTRAESVNYKVREAQLKKIPLIITIGENEIKNKTIAVRTLDGRVYFDLELNKFLEKIIKNIEKKEINFKL
jgi:threonyl-tRNA synthetase